MSTQMARDFRRELAQRQSGAIEVSPLQVVKEENEQFPFGQSGEKLS